MGQFGTEIGHYGTQMGHCGTQMGHCGKNMGHSGTQIGQCHTNGTLWHTNGTLWHTNGTLWHTNGKICHLNLSYASRPRQTDGRNGGGNQRFIGRNADIFIYISVYAQRVKFSLFLKKVTIYLPSSALYNWKLAIKVVWLTIWVTKV